MLEVNRISNDHLSIITAMFARKPTMFVLLKIYRWLDTLDRAGSIRVVFLVLFHASSLVDDIANFS